jgi:hypothetical protein
MCEKKQNNKKTWKKSASQQAANAKVNGAVKHDLTPVGAARILEAFMRMEKAKLGGVYVRERERKRGRERERV